MLRESLPTCLCGDHSYGGGGGFFSPRLNRLTPVTEVAMIFDQKGHVIFWLSPNDSSGCYIPDSQVLWDRVWRNRDRVGGIAHTHPWTGRACPSNTDVTTWSAIERGLGKNLLWPIVTMTEVRYFVRNVLTGEYVETPSTFEGSHDWQEAIEELRRLSQGE